jgi:WD40 repeat protein
MMLRSPFKFLDSFTKDDREIFFGRDREIEELHTRVFESKILLVYGTSGTGKSSLINCGLANRFNDSDWLPVNIRRGTDINRSLFDALAKTAVTKAPFGKHGVSFTAGYNLEKLLRSVWLDHFKPVFLIFDQFEELFIFGSREEKNELIKNVAKVLDSDIQCRFIFSIREEYLAGVTEFEKEIPSFLANRIRIEKMTRQNAIQTIEGPCRINNIEVEGGFAEALLQKLNPDKPEVELTWLQIYLDRIMRLAGSGDYTVKKLTGDLLEKAGEVKDILGTFLEEQISQLDDPETGMAILKAFVSVKGTKHQISENDVIEYSGTFGKKTDSGTIKALIQKFIKLRILRDKDENGRYELRHDSLASKIFEDITLVEKELLEIKTFIENAYSNYERRGQLLSDEDLKYIAPYEDKLYLNEKNQRFIDESKQAIHRVRRRRLNFAIAAAAALIIVLSFFSIWAFTERGKAREKQKFAEQKMEEANLANEEARAASLRAQRGEETARIEGERAKEQQKLAEKRTAEAEWERANAARSEKQALEEKRRAEENERDAINAKHEADTQRIKAQNAEEEANRLSLLSTAQNLALISMTLEKKPEIMGLLAVQAFNFNTRNGGPVDDPVIYQALDKAFSVLDNSKHSVLKGSVNEIRCLSEKKDGLLGADLDGNLIMWTYDGNARVVEQNTPQSFISHISLNPRDNRMIIAYENKQLILREQIKSDRQDKQLNCHSGTISSSAWSSTGDYLATGGTDSLICIWETSSPSGEPVKKFKGSSAIRNLEFCNEDTLFSAHEDGSICIWDLRSSTGRLLYPPGKEKALCLAWDISRKNLLSGTSAGTIMMFSFGPGTLDTVRYSSHGAGIDHIIYNKDFSLVATSSWDKTIRIYNFNEFFNRRNFIRGVIDIDDLESRSRVMMFTSDNKLVSGMSDKTIRIWETSPGKLVTMIISLVNRNLTEAEWSGYIGTEIPYEKTYGNNPL